jgi:hypothetical protein
VSSIVIQGDTSGSITVEAPSIAGTHTLTLPKATGNIATDATVGLGVKNLIINGDMRIDQRNAGASVTITSALYTLDRWQATQSVSSKYSVQQVTDAPVGATHSLKATSLSAYTVGASESFVIRQQIEGNNIAHLDWGTSNAKTVTLSFWVKSSLTGTFGGIIKSNGGGRTYPITYDINSANTWEQKSITISGDTTGTWLTTNGVGIQVVFNIGTGATLSGTANTWSSTNYNSATGATSLLATNGATLQVSLVQLEVGENATPFENRMYGTELALCQRYYEKSYNIEIVPGTSSTVGFTGYYLSTARSNNYVLNVVRYKVPKRTGATITLYNWTGTSGRIGNGDSGADLGTADVIYSGQNSFSPRNTSGGNMGPVYIAHHWTASAEL